MKRSRRGRPKPERGKANPENARREKSPDDSNLSAAEGYYDNGGTQQREHMKRDMGGVAPSHIVEE